MPPFEKNVSALQGVYQYVYIGMFICINRFYKFL